MKTIIQNRAIVYMNPKLIFLLATFLLFTPAHSHYSTEGVTDNFNAMLTTPTTPARPGESFATQVVRPYAQRPAQDMGLFSNPKANYTAWHSKKAHITPVEIIETMGVSWRGIENHEQAGRYTKISDAQVNGIFNIVRGDFGIAERAATPQEEATMARELLNMGRKLNASLDKKIRELEGKYNASHHTFEKQHFQMCALFLLSGAGKVCSQHSWYFEGLDEGQVMMKISQYDNVKNLPPIVAGGAGAGAGAASGVVGPRPTASATMAIDLTKKISLLGSGLYATHGIKLSNLHRAKTAYPNLPVLISNTRTQATDIYIAAEFAKDNYFMIHRPNRDDYIVIQFDEGEASRGFLTEKVQATKEDGEKTAIFCAETSKGRRFHYWVPTAAQIMGLNTFLSENTQGFTIDELYGEITREENNLDPKIKTKIDEILGKK